MTFQIKAQELILQYKLFWSRLASKNKRLLEIPIHFMRRSLFLIKTEDKWNIILLTTWQLSSWVLCIRYQAEVEKTARTARGTCGHFPLNWGHFCLEITHLHCDFLPIERKQHQYWGSFWGLMDFQDEDYGLRMD